jgi:hypothetical protein
MKVIHVLRKPLSEKTVAANVLEHGTGALNIDRCRVTPLPGEYVAPGGLSDPTSRSGTVGTDLGISRKDKTAFQQAQLASIERANRLGRWPSNLILEHPLSCAASCAPGCPVPALDEQSADTGGASRFYKQVGGHK